MENYDTFSTTLWKTIVLFPQGCGKLLAPISITQWHTYQIDCHQRIDYALHCLKITRNDSIYLIRIITRLQTIVDASQCIILSRIDHVFDNVRMDDIGGVLIGLDKSLSLC